MEENNSSKKKSIITLILLIVLIIGVVGIYLLLSKNKAKTGLVTENVTPTGPERGEIGFVEPTTTVRIGTREVSKGNFQKIEGNVIYYQEGGEVFSLPLTSEEISVSCTDQSLNNATELDYTKVTKVKIFTPQTIIGSIPLNEPIVVFAAKVGNTLTAHTVAMKTSSCPE